MRFFSVGLIAASLLLTGCARVTTSTAIHADGSFHEKTVYTGSTMGGLPGMKDSGSGGPGMNVSLEKQFAIRKGPGIAVTHSKDKDGSEVITVERDVAANADGTENVVAMTDKGKPLMTGTVTVHTLASGEIAYDERLKWSGAVTPLDFANPEWRTKIKAALPDKYRSSTQTVDRTMKAMATAIVHVMMGPPYPMLFDLMGNTDAAVLRIESDVAPQLKKEMMTGVPELGSEEREATIANMLRSMNMDELTKETQTKSGIPQSPASAGQTSSDTSGFDPLLFKVSFPGKVVETNGLTDPISGVVYWSLYPISASFGEVDLHLVVKP